MANNFYDSLQSKNLSFGEKESLCNFCFDEARDKYGPFWHFCTPGNLTEILNVTDDDYRFSVSNMAISAFESGIVVVTDAHMENHFHGLLGGKKEKCQFFLESFRFRLNRHLLSSGRKVDLRNFKCDSPILIKELEMMRSEIVYINRNGFVNDPRYVPFSYPWGGGSLYFNLFAQRETGVTFNEISFREKRNMLCRRVFDLPAGYQVKDGMILPSSYVDYRLGQSMFHDSHHYLSCLLKNVESYSNIAARYGDPAVLGREEMYPAVSSHCLRKYNVRQPSQLSRDAKLEVARKMHYELKASNAQIRMILGLSEYEVDSMFPLKALRTK